MSAFYPQCGTAPACKNFSKFNAKIETDNIRLRQENRDLRAKLAKASALLDLGSHTLGKVTV